MKAIRFRLVVMNFLIFAVWGAYLCSLGLYLKRVGLGDDIGKFFAIQGIVSLFMPALMGVVADRWIPAQKLLGICHFLAAVLMALAGYMGYTYGNGITLRQLFPFYALSVAFFMPTIALGNSVSYNALTEAGLDTVKSFPPIRVFGTIGFVASMWIVNFAGYKTGYEQLFVSAAWSLILAVYSFSLPKCPTNKVESKSFVDIFGLRAFSLFKEAKMCMFFIFSFLLGMCLQITNGFASPYLEAFGLSQKYANAFVVKNNLFLLSISQISEALCILLIPFFLKKFGIKKVMFIAFMAWTLRFFFLGAGSPTGFGLVLLILSMIVYGVAFDFFNISGSLFVEQNTDEKIRSSAQGVFMMMTNGIGATVGSLCAQAIVNHYTKITDPSDASKLIDNPNFPELMSGWTSSWYVFAAFALVVGILFVVLFKNKNTP